MKLRKSRERRKGRIEIIPMIDVMFFLLVTFMLASLSMQNLHSLRVNLPKGHATPTQTKSTVTLTVTKESRIYLDQTPVTLETLEATLRPMLKDAGYQRHSRRRQRGAARGHRAGHAQGPPGGRAALPDRG